MRTCRSKPWQSVRAHQPQLNAAYVFYEYGSVSALTAIPSISCICGGMSIWMRPRQAAHAHEIPDNINCDDSVDDCSAAVLTPACTPVKSRIQTIHISAFLSTDEICGPSSALVHLLLRPRAASMLDILRGHPQGLCPAERLIQRLQLLAFGDTVHGHIASSTRSC